MKCKSFEIFRMEVQGNGFLDETVVLFSELATDSFNVQEDSYKLFSIVPGVPGICTKTSNNYLAINQLYTLTENKTVELVLKIQTAGTYILRASDFSSMDATSQIFLEDLTTGTFQNLRQNNVYSCQVGTGIIESRFYLHFKTPIFIEPSLPSCSNNDATLTINYNSTDSINISISDEIGSFITELINFNGTALIDSLIPGNYIASIIFPDSTIGYTYATINTNYPVQNEIQTSTSQTIPNQEIIFVVWANNSVTHTWNFGDGTVVVTTQSSVTHSYNQPGEYLVSVISDNTICSDTANTTIEILNISGITELELNVLLNKNLLIYDTYGRNVSDLRSQGIYLIYNNGRFKKIYNIDK